MKNKKGQESQKVFMKILIGIVFFVILLYGIRYLVKILTGGSS